MSADTITAAATAAKSEDMVLQLVLATERHQAFAALLEVGAPDLYADRLGVLLALNEQMAREIGVMARRVTAMC